MFRFTIENEPADAKKFPLYDPQDSSTIVISDICDKIFVDTKCATGLAVEEIFDLDKRRVAARRNI